MRKSVMVLLVIASMLIFGWTTLAPSQAQSPIGLYGSWTSTQYPGSGGAIQVTDLTVSGDGALAGRMFFTGSPCAVWAVFSGRIYGDLASLAMNVGQCGPVEISLGRQGNQWVGTYQSAYPDTGVIRMVQ
jgi:hypothetical protein